MILCKLISAYISLSQPCSWWGCARGSNSWLLAQSMIDPWWHVIRHFNACEPSVVSVTISLPGMALWLLGYGSHRLLNIVQVHGSVVFNQAWLRATRRGQSKFGSIGVWCLLFMRKTKTRKKQRPSHQNPKTKQTKTNKLNKNKVWELTRAPCARLASGHPPWPE